MLHVQQQQSHKVYRPEWDFSRRSRSRSGSEYGLLAACGQPCLTATGFFFAGWTAFEIGSGLHSMISRVPEGSAETNRAWLNLNGESKNIERLVQSQQNFSRRMQNTACDGFNLYINTLSIGPTGSAGEAMGQAMQTVIQETSSPEYMDNASDTKA